MVVTAESVQERGLSAGMSQTAAAHVEAVEAARREKRARPDNRTEFRGVRRLGSGHYGAQIWDRLQRANVWLGTFGTAEEAARAVDDATVQLSGAAETNFKIPAAVHSCASVTVVKAKSGQEQGLCAGNCEIAEKHRDGVDAQAKFESVHKYYERTMDSRAGLYDGMGMVCPVIGWQLDALHGLAGAASPVVPLPPATTVGVPGMVGPFAVWPLAELPPVGATAGMATPVIGGNMSFGTSNTEDSGDKGINDMGERGKRVSEAAGGGSGKMMRFFDGLTKQAMERQETLQQRIVEDIEKREQDRMIREEAWRRQVMAREQEILAQERAMVATRGAAVLSFIQKITGQTIPDAAAPPPSSQPPSSTRLQPSLRPHKPPTMPPMTPADAETPHDIPGGCGGAALSSRWSNTEVHALIQLRSNLLDMQYQQAGPKGPVWEEISAAMRRMGYSRSSKQCREKWDNMNKHFKKVKESNKDPRRCSYFHQLEAFYRNKAVLYANAAPPDVIEAFTVAVPISQWAPQPHTLPPVSNWLYGAAANTNFEQPPTGATADEDGKSSVDLLNDLPELNFTY